MVTLKLKDSGFQQHWGKIIIIHVRDINFPVRKLTLYPCVQALVGFVYEI